MRGGEGEGRRECGWGVVVEGSAVRDVEASGVVREQFCFLEKRDIVTHGEALYVIAFGCCLRRSGIGAC